MILRHHLAICFLLGLLLVLLAAILNVSVVPKLGAQGSSLDRTPVSGHSEVHTTFPFLVKFTPEQIGWTTAEFKDEYGRKFYKIDALPGCGQWLGVPGDTQPGLLLHPGGLCGGGFTIEYGFIYWFSTPRNDSPVTPPVSPPFPTATGSPPLGTGTAVPIPPSPTPTPGTPTFPSLPECAIAVWFYWAGDPAAGGLGGHVGDVGWCEGCRYQNSCGVWSLGVDRQALDDIAAYARQRVMATPTPDGR